MENGDYPRHIFHPCGMEAALEVVGERWSFLILRGVFNGLHHFEEFQSTLGIARNILSNRLTRLVDNGILERRPDTVDRRKVAYELTECGRALMPVLVALRQWGETWLSKTPSRVVLVDRAMRRPIAPVDVRSADGRPLGLGDLEWIEQSGSPSV